MFEVTFRIQHNCPYTRFSIKHPSVRIVEWCNNKTHVMEIQSPDIATFARAPRKAESKILQAVSPYVRMYGSKRALEAPSPLLAK